MSLLVQGYRYDYNKIAGHFDVLCDLSSSRRVESASIPYRSKSHINLLPTSSNDFFILQNPRGGEKNTKKNFQNLFLDADDTFGQNLKNKLSCK